MTAKKRNPLPSMQLSGGNRPSLLTSDATLLHGGEGEMVPRHESDLTRTCCRKMDMSTIGWRKLRRNNGRRHILLQVSVIVTDDPLNSFFGSLTLLFVQMVLLFFCLRHGGSDILHRNDMMKLFQMKEDTEKKGVIQRIHH